MDKIHYAELVSTTQPHGFRILRILRATSVLDHRSVLVPRSRKRYVGDDVATAELEAVQSPQLITRDSINRRRLGNDLGA